MLAPSLPPVHSKLRAQRIRRNIPVENQTGTHTSRHARPQPTGRKIAQAQYTQILNIYNVDSPQHSLPQRGVGKIVERHTHPAHATLLTNHLEAIKVPFGVNVTK